MSLELYILVSRDDACIAAILDGEEVGTYWIDLIKEGYESIIADSYMNSKVAGKGVPRALIKEATIILQKIATRRNVRVTHLAEFRKEDSREKLSHIFEEFGYSKIGQNYGREYLP